MSAFGGLRTQVAGALRALDVEEWSINDGPVDAISPPAFVLVWSDPWLTPRTPCVYDARLQVICAAARVDPTPGYVQLETMLEQALGALQTARLPIFSVGMPSPYECGGLAYQAARITLVSPLSLTHVQPLTGGEAL